LPIRPSQNDLPIGSELALRLVHAADYLFVPVPFFVKFFVRIPFFYSFQKAVQDNQFCAILLKWFCAFPAVKALKSLFLAAKQHCLTFI
jgi:hypothetical protein